jgi:hypothetical protein
LHFTLYKENVMAKPESRSRKKEPLPQDLVALRQSIEDSPVYLQKQQLPLITRVEQFTRLQGRLVKIAQDAVDQLQLDIKYLLFDLEVTRKERNALQQQIDEGYEEC